MPHLKVNRHLADEAMDKIDHALGRPLDPTGETYRNFYAAPTDVAAEFAKTPYWNIGPIITRGLIGCTVTSAGRKALADHLVAIGERHRAFDVTFQGYTTTVVGTSASKARYSYFLNIRDCLPDLTFSDFCRRSTIRSACVIVSKTKQPTSTPRFARRSA